MLRTTAARYARTTANTWPGPVNSGGRSTRCGATVIGIGSRRSRPIAGGSAPNPDSRSANETLLVRTGTGIVLWDPVSCLDDETVATIGDLGGVQAISASHPHFYGAIVEWSHAFDGASIPLPEADRFWVWRTDAAYVCYQDLVSPVPGVSSFAVVDISTAALCCTGRRVPVERVRCSRETPSRSSWTGALPASCAHTRT